MFYLIKTVNDPWLSNYMLPTFNKLYNYQNIYKLVLKLVILTSSNKTVIKTAMLLHGRVAGLSNLKTVETSFKFQ